MGLNGFVDSAAQQNNESGAQGNRVYGVAIAEVINNVDALSQGRVQVSFPWLPGVEPWARVATPMAGSDRGLYMMPQVGEEVLVAFNHGDVNEPYIVGGLWNGQDRPPANSPIDAVNRRVLRTPLGHEVEFDDLQQTITITSSTQQTVKITPTEIELATTGGTASIKMSTAGTIKIDATTAIELNAPVVSIKGQSVELKADAAATINGGGACTIQAQLVSIN